MSYRSKIRRLIPPAPLRIALSLAALGSVAWDDMTPRCQAIDANPAALSASEVEEPISTDEPIVAFRRDASPQASIESDGINQTVDNGSGDDQFVSEAPVDGRRLAPLSIERRQGASRPPAARPHQGLMDRLAIEPGARGALAKAATGLGAVVALLLLSTWALKRRSHFSSGTLPPEAFTLLGRAQLADRTVVQLFRLGSKLVLASSTPDGLRPLTEITDPHEVERIAGVCSRGRLHGPAAEFQQVLAQLSREPARGFLGGEARRG